MRISPWITVAGALIALIVLGYLGVQLIQPTRPLLEAVAFSHAAITPNADGADDVTRIAYRLNRTAQVSVLFRDKATGAEFRFRDGAMRPPDRYEVLFSGVVDGYTLPAETYDPALAGVIERRLMPNGDYTWTVEAAADGEAAVTFSGDLSIREADSRFPAMTAFEIAPDVFSPNQDGYADRVYLHIALAKPASLTVYLENQALGIGPIYIAERTDGGRKPGEAGMHEFDYDGGLDNNIVPPPDGDYIVVAVAQDAEGQRVRRIASLTIRDSGQPNAEIVAQSTGRTVTWETRAWNDAYFTTGDAPGKTVEAPSGVQSTAVTVTLPQGDLLIFRLAVSNYGTTPIRTIGPFPGTVYQYDQTDAAMSDPAQREAISGAWRIGLQCERSESSYPWRWALGSQDSLTRVERDGEILWYLPPGQTSVVWGAVRMTELIPTRNPQKCFAALIHEDVAIPPLQNRVGEIDVKLR